jgi:hypothetical protein
MAAFWMYAQTGEAALDSSFEDFLFQDNVDSLVAHRVAKGLFGFLDKPRYYDEERFSIPDRTIASWEKLPRTSFASGCVEN